MANEFKMAGETAEEFVDKYYGTFNDVEWAKMEARMHKVRPIKEPYARYVNQDSCVHWAHGVGDMNPLYRDPEYAKTTRYGKLIAPHCCYFSFGWGALDLRYGQGFPGVHAYHSGDDWYYYRPLYDGDKIHATKELDNIREVHGRFAKKQYIQTSILRYYDEENKPTAIEYYPVFRSERSDSKKAGKYNDIKRAFYTPEDVEWIRDQVEHEPRRGAETRYWEDVNIGDDAGYILRGPLTVADMICWLEATGSGFLQSGQEWHERIKKTPKIAIPDPETGWPEPIERVHWDNAMAQQVGDPAAYDYGAQRGSWATHYFNNWSGDDGFLCELHYQFRGFLYMTDYCRISGVVEDKWIGKKTGTGYVRIKFKSEDQRGRDVMPGNGVVALPTRSNGPVQFPVDVLEDGRAD